MAKRKEDTPPPGSPAWMSTFSDLMNLLLCFFVLLFASSTMDAEKIEKIAASFNNIEFDIIESDSVSIVDGAMVSGGVTQLPGIESILEYIGVATKPQGNNDESQATGIQDNQNEQPDNIDEFEIDEQTTVRESLSEKELQEQLMEKGLKQSEEMYDEISQMTESYSIEDKIVLDYNSQYVSLDLKGAVLFDAGKADIRDDAKVFMEKIALIMQKYKKCVIEIEGHTDSIPVSNAQFESNRYLSTARATKVYEFVMQNAKLIDKNVKVAGYGESRPIASNKTEEGRSKNRRVSIKIYNQLNSNSQIEE